MGRRAERREGGRGGGEQDEGERRSGERDTSEERRGVKCGEGGTEMTGDRRERGGVQKRGGGEDYYCGPGSVAYEKRELESCHSAMLSWHLLLLVCHFIIQKNTHWISILSWNRSAQCTSFLHCVVSESMGS